jgi:hypothetical protein
LNNNLAISLKFKIGTFHGKKCGAFTTLPSSSENARERESLAKFQATTG